MSIRHLDQLLEPESIAVIGASDRVGSVGATVWRNLRAAPFKGPIFGVNPKHKTLDGEAALFGQGGTAVEVLADRAVALPPLNRALAREMVSRTRVARLLAGYRDRAPVHLDAVCDVLIAISQSLADLPELAELDINPLWADAEGVLALDARLRVSRARPAGAAHFAITPYPAELVQTVDWHGERIELRPIRPEDAAQHRAFIDRVAPNDLRLRFFSARRELPRSELARLTQIDYAREMAFIAVRLPPGGTAQTLGVVRAVIDPDNVDAEFAITVRSDLQRRGLGRVLLRKMIAYLSACGTQRLVGFVLRENDGMRELARSLGLAVNAAESDSNSLHFALTLPAFPAPATRRAA